MTAVTAARSSRRSAEGCRSFSWKSATDCRFYLLTSLQIRSCQCVEFIVMPSVAYYNEFLKDVHGKHGACAIKHMAELDPLHNRWPVTAVSLFPVSV